MCIYIICIYICRQRERERGREGERERERERGREGQGQRQRQRERDSGAGFGRSIVAAVVVMSRWYAARGGRAHTETYSRMRTHAHTETHSSLAAHIGITGQSASYKTKNTKTPPTLNRSSNLLEKPQAKTSTRNARHESPKKIRTAPTGLHVHRLSVVVTLWQQAGLGFRFLGLWTKITAVQTMQYKCGIPLAKEGRKLVLCAMFF